MLDFLIKVKERIVSATKFFYIFLIQSPLIATGLFFVLAILMFGGVYFANPGIAFLDDHFFHFKLAYLLRTEGWQILDNFNWIYLTNQAQENIRYPISLFQISLIPFTFFQDMIFGLKFSDVFWASASASIIFYVLLKMKVRFPLVFALAILSGYIFFARMMLGRALVLIVGLVFLELHLAIRKKYKALLLVSFLHVVWHPSTIFFPVMIVLTVELSRYLAEKNFFSKNLWSALIATMLGSFFYGVSYIRGLVQGLLQVTQKAQAGQAGQGGELYTSDIFKIMSGSEVLFFILLLNFALVVYLYVSNRGEEKSARSSELVAVFALFFFCLASFAGTILLSGRFYDFYSPSAIILLAVLVTFFLKDNNLSQRVVFKFIFCAIIIFFSFKIVKTFFDVKEKAASNDYRPLAAVANWVESESNDGERVYLDDWGFFPVAFFYNHKNIYSMGIEPMALFDYNPKLYWKWYNFSQNNFYCEEAADCKEERDKITQYLNGKSEDVKADFFQENYRKFLNSVKNDFGAKFVILSGNEKEIKDMLTLDKESIEASFKQKSEYNDKIFLGIKLK